MSFTIENKPDWLSFDATSGRLYGEAAIGTEGVYEDIRIGISDGVHSTSLPPFTVEVTQAALGSVTLSWTPPVENSDGSPLDDLAAYKIYYGTSAGSYIHSIYIDNPGIATYVVENLVPGTYQFVVTSINTAGVESGFSNVATKVVDPI